MGGGGAKGLEWAKMCKKNRQNGNNLEFWGSMHRDTKLKICSIWLNFQNARTLYRDHANSSRKTECF